MRIIEEIGDGDVTPLGWTYIFQSKDGTFVKIGKTRKKIKYRLATVRKSHNYEQYDMSFLFAIENESFEKILHDAFERYRARYTWSENFKNASHMISDSDGECFDIKSCQKIENYLKLHDIVEGNDFINHLTISDVKVLVNLPPLAKDEPRDVEHINGINEAEKDSRILCFLRPTRVEIFKFDEILSKEQLLYLVRKEIEPFSCLK